MVPWVDPTRESCPPQLGLCMGFSLISAAEVLFHAVQVVFAVIVPRPYRRSARLPPSHGYADEQVWY